MLGYVYKRKVGSGGLKCWGLNDNGQLGDGLTNQQNDASTVSTIVSNAVSVDLGRHHTCAIDSSQSLHCWGGGSNGQIGDGSTSEQVVSPTEISLGQNLGANSVSSGGSYTCVVGTNDLLRCWGGDGFTSALDLGATPTLFTAI